MSKDKLVRINLDGTAVTESGKSKKTKFFEYLDYDFDDYSNLSFTPEEAMRIHMHMNKLQTGSAAMVPLFCQGNQCQPPGTLIKTSNAGDISIENLDPEFHKLITYDLNNHLLRKGERDKGYGFSVQSREYKGKLVNLEVGDKVHQCTSEHICIAKWNESAKDLFVVYLMEKDGFFRIGKTTLFKSFDIAKRSFGPGLRARAEKAHRLWILGLCKTNTEALLMEEKYSVMYGISKALFIATKNQKTKWEGLYAWVTQEQLNEHHSSLKQDIQYYEKVLQDFGLNIHYPLWSSDDARCICYSFGNRKKKFNSLGGKKVLVIRASNVIDKYMNMAIPGEPVIRDYRIKNGDIRQKIAGTGLEWKQVRKSLVDYEGKVYSLEVEKYHTYVANDIVTHNCPFSNQCPLVAAGKPPIGKKCLLEVSMMKHWIYQYMEEYNVDPENFTEVGYCNELSEIEVYLWRLNNNLAKPENAQLVVDQPVGVDSNGDPIMQQQVSPFMEMKEKLQNRRSKIIKLMVGDRQERYRKEAALKQKGEQEASGKQKELRRKIEELKRRFDSIDASEEQKLLPVVLTPDELLDSQ